MEEGQPVMPAAPDPTKDAARVLESQELLAGQREVLIRHGDDVYRLRLTSNNKLILMK
ncbi:MAG: hemin uptake protein HemP [Alphaproteobacteria bacterium]|nr:hemin uptake protein HemP [Alphaproteobacteria bacterium]